MGTKNLATQNDCYNRALDNEEMFVLLARDLAAPAAIRKWVHERVYLGLNKRDDALIREALDVAKRMELSRETIRKTLGKSH
jgi:hypothetical protein